MALPSAVWVTVYAFLDGDSLVYVGCASRQHRERLRAHVRRWRQIQCGLGLGSWLRREACLTIDTCAQEAQSHAIRRSDDARVPPRVETSWVELGPIAPERSLHRMTTPCYAGASMIVLTFDCRHVQPAPMLLHTTSHARALYSSLSLSVQGRSLRQHVYHKTMGDLTTVSVADKHAMTTAGDVYQCDVASTDKSIQLQLGLPSRLDGMVDCFHIERVTFFLHKHELFPSVHRSVEASSDVVLAELAFFDVRQRTCQLRVTVPCRLALEAPAAPSPATRSAGTDTESFEIRTFSSLSPTPVSNVAALDTPGLVSLVLRTSRRRKSYYHAVFGHGGGQRRTGATKLISASWVPGVLTYAMHPGSTTRRVLKGRFTCEYASETGALASLQIIAQHLRPERLERYAATLTSYTA
ncbi:hypothetical protein SPRG_02012 [Saprolegnia parasitica CBS 223.65]|uniref:Uncharacterized protein n=1 Tax=Saprolegnia parasitica (strain CBS 223.65) TaxID=695850 RepID=A0A067CVE7_SAPPC|nr:hypothetical protein SPRG_02012 [Saprolegnia parasitica CBS 223.65]KDO33200.1 hypothetical protein SPRG_02012 [Saprolegnia parasitica CBS 223.65]|eukprot:XP_012195961.1 hypothetical protein SPRG_02012 [Saprolegnia parasitica CBS 223.65]